MPTASELVVAIELRDLQDVAAMLGWVVRPLTPSTFVVGLTAKDGSTLYVHCDATGYSGTPPAWRWCDRKGERQDDPELSPQSGPSAFFHPNGVICAPWNRLAYQTVDPRGPHSDWTIGNWQANSYTRECKTLTAMVTRIELELHFRFAGRVKVAA